MLAKPMPTVTWKGGSPPRALREQLEHAGWSLHERGAVTVVRAAELPDAPPPAPWVWLCARPVGVARLQRAVDMGASDVIVETEAGAGARLLKRLAEALVAPPQVPTAPGFVAVSPAARAVLARIHEAAQTNMPVLLTGETGTGKELAAHLIHEWSARAKRTFVPINCAAIPNELMEGELFGYVRGAFSGATRDYDGQLGAGEGGTVFLDEIDETPHALQVKLLRVLEDRVISRLGENVWRRVDFRLVAATNRDLRRLIAEGQFGDDLFERLATVQVELPPLRERLEDLPELLKGLFERYYVEDPRARRRHQVAHVSDAALEVLRAYGWPGNVRELRNVVFGALVHKRSGDELLVSDLPRRLWAKGAAADEGALEARLAAGHFNLRREVEALERRALEAALAHAHGNAAAAARLLGEVGRGAAKDPGGTVRVMMKRLGVRPGA